LRFLQGTHADGTHRRLLALGSEGVDEESSLELLVVPPRAIVSSMVNGQPRNVCHASRDRFEKFLANDD
jgi:hypothetical protein